MNTIILFYSIETDDCSYNVHTMFIQSCGHDPLTTISINKTCLQYFLKILEYSL